MADVSGSWLIKTVDLIIGVLALSNMTVTEKDHNLGYLVFMTLFSSISFQIFARFPEGKVEITLALVLMLASALFLSYQLFYHDSMLAVMPVTNAWKLICLFLCQTAAAMVLFAAALGFNVFRMQIGAVTILIQMSASSWLHLLAAVPCLNLLFLGVGMIGHLWGHWISWLIVMASELWILMGILVQDWWPVFFSIEPWIWLLAGFLGILLMRLSFSLRRRRLLR